MAAGLSDRVFDMADLVSLTFVRCRRLRVWPPLPPKTRDGDDVGPLTGTATPILRKSRWGKLATPANPLACFTIENKHAGRASSCADNLHDALITKGRYVHALVHALVANASDCPSA
jgi:hypothetical protein